MASARSQRGFLGRLSLGILAVFKAVGLLMLELVAAMMVYIGLALYDLNLFGSLVRVARDVLQIVASVIETMFPASANQAYATLLGELGPKSILLLMIGLVVGALLRFILWTVGRALAAASGR
ncbi:MAG: hypothetical protein ACFCUN_05330 [Hyphomicrobiaceae bacterium]